MTTPALLLDLDVARRNIAAMADRLQPFGTQLRPHIKAHKCVELAELQLAAGAIGVACATVWEAAAMALRVDDILVANQIVTAEKLAVLAALATERRITVAVDDADNVAALADAAARAGAILEIVIEVDVGMRRGGARTVEEALVLADAVARLPSLRLRGVQGYEGHCMGEPDSAVRGRATRLANARLTEAVDRLAAAGHQPAVVSAGGTGTFAITAADPKITEIQAGSYVVMDEFHDRLVPGAFDFALSVLGTAVSRHGSTVVLDAGRKSVSTDFGMPHLAAYPDARVRLFAEEHCLVDFAGAPPLAPGDTAEITIDYAPTTVNLHDVFHVVEDGVVTGIWRICARGSGPSYP